MILVFLGKQFVGKGTYAQNIVKKFGIEMVSAGDLVRAEAKKDTELGRKVKEITEKGGYLDDETITGLLKEKAIQADSSRGMIFDGYPRSEGQARLLDEMLSEKGLKVDLAINFTGSEEILVGRAANRRTCPKCGQIYNLKSKPPKEEGKCDACGSELYQRPDDTPEAIRQRMKQHDEKEKPILEYYGQRGILEEIDGARPIPDVNRDVEELLKKKFDISAD